MFASYFEGESRRRSLLEIKIDVLQSIAEGSFKHNHIMYAAKLPWKKCRAVVGMMERQGLIEKVVPEEGKKFSGYILTERGKRVLEATTTVVRELNSHIPSSEPVDASAIVVRQD